MNTQIYVIAGIHNGKIGFLAFDSTSGDYPYISGVIRDQTFDKLKALSWLEDAKMTDLEEAEIYEICLN